MTDTFDIEVGGFPGGKGDPGSPGEGYSTRAAMAARLAPSLLDDVYLTEAGREGKFVVDAASSWTTAIAADTAHGIFVASTADATKVYRRVHDGFLRPEWFGAPADGVSDDGPGMAAMSAFINANGSGSVSLSPVLYRVGSTTLHNPSVDQFGAPGGLYRFYPNTPVPLDINGCSGPVVVRLNGATIRTLAGAKYGTFNLDGSVMASALGYSGDGIGVPYIAMLRVKGCTGRVSIEGPADLDGNIENALIGGYWASDSSGRQIPMTGIVLEDSPNVTIDGKKIRSHHHGLDGMTGNGPGLLNTAENVVIRGVECTNNGRQNYSLVGGNGWKHYDCKFNQCGRGLGTMAPSLPGAGVDLEAEGGKYVVRARFFNSDAEDNYGQGVIGDSSANTFDMEWHGGRIIGTTNYSVWADRPGFRFIETLIAGPITHPYDSTNQDEAAQFIRCTFTNDPAVSPTGTLYDPGAGVATFMDLAGALDNVLFDRCFFHKMAAGTVISGIDAEAKAGRGPFFDNCSFRDDSGSGHHNVYGIFRGRDTTFVNIQSFPGTAAESPWGGTNSAAGVALDSYTWGFPRIGIAVAAARFEPSYARDNFKALLRGSTTYDPPSLAAGAKTTIQTFTLTGVAVGDAVVETTFSQALAGANINAWISAADTVSFYFINENGANPLDLASGTLKVKVRKA